MGRISENDSGNLTDLVAEGALSDARPSQALVESVAGWWIMGAFNSIL